VKEWYNPRHLAERGGARGNPRLCWFGVWAILIWLISGVASIQIDLVALLVVVLAIPSLFLTIKLGSVTTDIKMYDWIGLLAVIAVVYAMIHHVRPQELFAFIECLWTKKNCSD
jgi:hypothetical protein